MTKVAASILSADFANLHKDCTRLLEAGADVLVAGSFVFSSPDPIRTIKELKEM